MTRLSSEEKIGKRGVLGGIGLYVGCYVFLYHLCFFWKVGVFGKVGAFFCFFRSRDGISLDGDFCDQWMKFSLVFSFGDGVGSDGKSKKESASYYPKVDIQSFIRKIGNSTTKHNAF